MAEGARDPRVPADESKACLVMIEADLRPGLRVVAVLALVAEDPVVGVLRSMAVHTIGHGIAMQLLGGVALRAGHALVSADQTEVREIVIEGLRVQTDDVTVSSDMLRVTDIALHSDSVAPAVKPSLSLDIHGYDVVAVEAKRTLLCPLERSVTVAALRLEILMPSYHLSRHDDPRQIDAGSTPWREDAGQQSDQQHASLLNTCGPREHERWLWQ